MEHSAPTLNRSDNPPQVQVAGHTLTLYVEFPPLLEAMLRDIQQARQRVWLETYIIHDDRAGQAIADALIERARLGVDVRLHYDTIGSLDAPSSYFRRLEEAGVQVHAFHSLWEALWNSSMLRILNRRNHRKLLVIDDQVAYFGGMNIIDVSNVHVTDRAEPLRFSRGWRDVHVRLEGPQQGELAESFERSWRRARGQPTPPRSRGYRQARLVGGAESIQFFDCGPGLRHTRAWRVFIQLFNAAQRSLLFSMAYFLPVGGVLRALLRAQRRGVFLRVVVPGSSDVPLVQCATQHLYLRLLRRRVHIYERQVNMLHSKVLIMDEAWTVIGSSNLDARSLFINLEFLAVIHSIPLAQAVRQIVAEEMNHSRRITLRDCLQRSWWQRLVDRLAWAFRWWL